jgi:hypothetical protein
MYFSAYIVFGIPGTFGIVDAVFVAVEPEAVLVPDAVEAECVAGLAGAADCAGVCPKAMEVGTKAAELSANSAMASFISTSILPPPIT